MWFISGVRMNDWEGNYRHLGGVRANPRISKHQICVLLYAISTAKHEMCISEAHAMSLESWMAKKNMLPETPCSKMNHAMPYRFLDPLKSSVLKAPLKISRSPCNIRLFTLFVSFYFVSH